MALPHRRGYGSTDEPSPATDGFIETDLSAGGPWLRDFLCAAYDIVPKSSPYKEILWHEGGRISSQLEDICCAKGYPNVTALFRGRYPRYEPDAERTVTLAVTVSEGRETVTPSCARIDLARILWRDLCERGFEGITVEVHDVRAVRRPEIYPCLPTDDIFPIWTDVAMEIFDKIDRAGVFTIGCFRIGAYRWERLECPPTVLIGVGRHSKRDWKDVRETVVSILDRRGLDSVAVTIRKDNKIARGVLGMDWEPGATIADCRPDLQPGTSLGPCSKHGIHSEGRLAGWVEVKNLQSENWVPFAMTCSHCCFPEETTLCAADIEVIHSWKHRGVHPGDAHRHRLLQVDSPNDNGMEKALTTLAGSIEEAKADLEDLEAETQEKKAHRLKVTLDDLTEAENKQAIFANFRNSKSHHLGTVFAASGERRAPSTADSKHLSIRDWALVQPAAPRCAGRNMVKHIAFPDKDQQLIHSSLFPGLPKMDEKLYTPGAKGVYGNLKTCHIFTKVENGHAIDIPTFEHVVVRCKTRVQWEERLDEPGSFIYSITGCTKGMIFGGSGSGDLGYFTATEDILDDIQHITGAEEVRLLYVDE